MKLTVWSFWCEWDIGINDGVWLELEDMKYAIRKALEDCDIEDELEVLEDEGLLGYEWKHVR